MFELLWNENLYLSASEASLIKYLFNPVIEIAQNFVGIN